MIKKVSDFIEFNEIEEERMVNDRAFFFDYRCSETHRL